MNALIDHIKKIIPTLYNIDKDSILQLDANNNTLFQCSNSDNEFILRITNYKSTEEQIEEVKWLRYLSNNEINVSHAIKSKLGNDVEKIELDKKKLTAVVFKKAKGHIASSKQWNTKLIERCGQVIGKMHNLSEKNNAVINKITTTDWFVQDCYDYKKHFPSNQKKLIGQCRKLYDAINVLTRDDHTYGVIHSDIHQGNFFVYNNDITLFDFQDFEQHYYINDLAIFIYFGVFNSYNGVDIQHYALKLITHLFKGYRTVRNLDPYWISKIPLFLKLREILSLIMFQYFYDLDKLSDDLKILRNLYRRNIESEIPVLDIEFENLPN